MSMYKLIVLISEVQLVCKSFCRSNHYYIVQYIAENVDYISTPISVTISAGETSVIFNASTIVDNTLENNETYNLAITVNPVSLINTNISINTGSTSVIIIDDDRK